MLSWTTTRAAPQSAVHPVDSLSGPGCPVVQGEKDSSIYFSLRPPHLRLLHWISSLKELASVHLATSLNGTGFDSRLNNSLVPVSNHGRQNHSLTAIAGLQQVADLIGAEPKEVIFTSGATESNNIAVKGVARFYASKKKHIITTQTEHKCVLDSCRALEGEGFSVTYLPVGPTGLIDMEQLEAAIRPDTSLVSIMFINNEIGVKQPIEEIGALCKAKKVFFHSDCAQGFGKVPLDVKKCNIDLMSISGHKIYGPKGIGALYVRRRPRVRIEPIQSGGGQERGMRSGTVPTPLAVGLGAASELAKTEMAYDHKWMETLSERLLDKICSRLPSVIRNGDPEHSYPGCINLSFAYVEGKKKVLIPSLYGTFRFIAARHFYGALLIKKNLID
uniref:cysteine desulfurase n=1 Tax=Timema tahoe TaxID=61484 RepID=A0A7R9IL13_9NEOP|nr:unnamed protein product [Timema tahoe]